MEKNKEDKKDEGDQEKDQTTRAGRFRKTAALKTQTNRTFSRTGKKLVGSHEQSREKSTRQSQWRKGPGNSRKRSKRLVKFFIDEEIFLLAFY